MSDVTDRLGLPLLAAGQSQKEVTHNAALTQLDMLMQSAVVAAFVTAPPAAPQPGQCWSGGVRPAPGPVRMMHWPNIVGRAGAFARPLTA